MRRSIAMPALAMFMAVMAAGQAASQRATPPLTQAAIQEHIGRRLPLDLSFNDVDGQSMRLGDVFDAEVPVLLVLADYDCRMLCGLVLQGAARTLHTSGLQLGRDYRALTIGIDPRDGVQHARAARVRALTIMNGSPTSSALGAAMVRNGGRPVHDARDWPFLLGQEAAVRSLAAALGFRFTYDAATDQFSHPAALFILTPDGRIASYLYGIRFAAPQLRAALLRAKDGVVGGSAEPFLLRCFRYLPALARHAGLIRAVLWTGAIATVLLLGTMLARLWRHDLRDSAP